MHGPTKGLIADLIRLVVILGIVGLILAVVKKQRRSQ